MRPLPPDEAYDGCVLFRDRDCVRSVVGVLLCVLPLVVAGCNATANESRGNDDDLGSDAADEVIFSDGCGLEPDGIGTTIEVGSRSRTYVLYLPDDYDPDQGHALVFAWHGLGGSGELAQYYFGIEELVDSEAVVVYPDGLVSADWGWSTGWDLAPSGYDFDFLDALYEHLGDKLCIDEERVFSTGHSFGGYMSNSVGCYRSGVFDAIAPVAGGPPYYGNCDGPIGAWITHGSADEVVLLAEGEETRDEWLSTNECSDTSEAAGLDPCVAYEGCARDVHWCQHTGGHEWPDFAPAAIWDFFAAQ